MEKQNGSMSKGLAQKTGERIDGAIDKMSGAGTAQKLGERIDKVADQVIDNLSGKGSAEKVGQEIDKAIKVQEPWLGIQIGSLVMVAAGAVAFLVVSSLKAAKRRDNG